MVSVPPTIAAEAAQTRLNATLSVIKQAAQADAQIANILTQAIESVPTSPVRGSILNTRA